MKISTRHQNLSDRLNNPRILENPEEFLGPNWKSVLNFWIYLDTLTDEQWKVIGKRYLDMDFYKWKASYDVAVKAAKKTTSYWNDVWYAAADFYRAEYATWEIIASHELLNQQKSFTFLSFFINP